MSDIQFESVEIADAWLWATLSVDEELIELTDDNISGTLSAAPLGPRYATFLHQDGRDVSAVGGIRISTSNLYAVKGVVQTSSWDDVKPIAKRIDYLIHRPGSVMVGPNGGSLTCIRESTIQYVDDQDSGMQYRHLGGIYRIRASAD